MAFYQDKKAVLFPKAVWVAVCISADDLQTVHCQSAEHNTAFALQQIMKTLETFLYLTGYLIKIKAENPGSADDICHFTHLTMKDFMTQYRLKMGNLSAWIVTVNTENHLMHIG